MSIAVTEFKVHCLSVIDDVAPGKSGPMVLTKRNRPVVAIVPIDDDELPDLWGAMRASVTVLPGTPPRDPGDQMIAATARTFGCALVTRDGVLVP